MKGRGDRSVRVGERIREELSLLLLRKVNDPGLAPVTVTEVSVTKDLRIAHVNYSALVASRGAPGRGQGAPPVLRFSAAGARSSTRPAIRPRTPVPLRRSFDRGARIDAILREIPEGKEGPDEG